MAQKEPVLPTMLCVGRIRFRAGVKVSAAQGAIDRLQARVVRMDKIIRNVWTFRNRLPSDLKQQILKGVRDA